MANPASGSPVQRWRVYLHAVSVYIPTSVRRDRPYAVPSQKSGKRPVLRPTSGELRAKPKAKSLTDDQSTSAQGTLFVNFYLVAEFVRFLTDVPQPRFGMQSAHPSSRNANTQRTYTDRSFRLAALYIVRTSNHSRTAGTVHPFHFRKYKYRPLSPKLNFMPSA